MLIVRNRKIFQRRLSISTLSFKNCSETNFKERNKLMITKEVIRDTTNFLEVSKKLAVKRLNFSGFKSLLNYERQKNPELNIHIKKVLIFSKVMKVCSVEKSRSNRALATLFNLAAAAKLSKHIKE